MAIPEKQNPPARVGSAGVGFGKSRRADSNPTATLLHALDTATGRTPSVAGKGWRSRCPACGGNSEKVSIATADDGRVLLHAFCGCDAVTVLAAVGLSVSDLFPQRLRDTSPEVRKALREAALQARWRAALGVLAFEAAVVHAAAHAVLHGPLSDDDQHRLTLAADRIDDARAILAPAEPFRPRACA